MSENNFAVEALDLTLALAAARREVEELRGQVEHLTACLAAEKAWGERNP